MTAHKHAELIAQYAQDATETDAPWERWEVRSNSESLWRTGSSVICFHSSCEYRRKPRTMTYTITIPEPLRGAPEVGTIVYIPTPLAKKLASAYCWYGDPPDECLLKRGLCFATGEDAIAAAKAMMPFKEEV